MALEMDIVTDIGVSFTSSYMIVYQVGGSKDNIKAQCHWYLDKDARDSRKKPIQVKTYSFAPSVEEGSDNFIKQSYDFLKTLPDFELAKDIVDSHSIDLTENGGDK